MPFPFSWVTFKFGIFPCKYSSFPYCIISGVENLDSGVGVYAPDADAYTTFAELFDPIIEEYHGGFGKDQKYDYYF